MALTLAQLNRLIDESCRYLERVRNYDSSTGYGIGEDGFTNLASGTADNIVSYVLSTADATVIEYLLTPANRIADVTEAARFTRDRFRNLWEKLEALVRLLGISGVTSIETYLAYYNTGAGGTWTALQNPAWYDLYYKWKGAYPHLTNPYFEIIKDGIWRGTSYANALGRFVVSGAGAGTFTDGAAVDYTKYAGGTGKINVSSLTGSGNVTITGLGMNPATRAVTASVTWITSISGTGLTTVVVGGGTAPADCLLVDVTNVTIAAGITAGTFYIEAHKPASRLAVPF